jgi:flagellar protein FlaG
MAIQSLGSAAAAPRPPQTDRASSGPISISANGANNRPQQAAVASGAVNTQNQVAQANGVDTANAVKRPDDPTSVDELNEAVKNINQSLSALSQNLEFSVDTDSKRTVVKVIDQQTKEVIRQIPSEETLEIAKALDTVKGLLIKQQA